METYIDSETVGALREDGLSNALMDEENHTILVTVEHYIWPNDDEPVEYERFTMLDWFPPSMIAASVAKYHQRLVESEHIASARIAVRSAKNPDIVYETAWR